MQTVRLANVRGHRLVGLIGLGVKAVEKPFGPRLGAPVLLASTAGVFASFYTA